MRGRFFAAVHGPRLRTNGEPHRTTIPMPESCADAESFLDVMRLLPSPVSVITALDEQGLPRGLTCSAVCSLSMAPPSLLACVNRKNRSLEAIRHSGGFVVNLLRAGGKETSEIFASPRSAKFANAAWRPSPASGLPLLTRDALAFVDCGLEAEIAVGSHIILVGLVRGSGTNTPDGGPLVYWRRSYGRWAAYDGAGARRIEDGAPGR
jgi:flavin reductase (DIM6/NTAB) family NADH-FMN oxidoreductase RutF